MRDRFFNKYALNEEESERGTALVLFTIMLALVLLPMIGLAIDGSAAYLVHERLVAATDAAALAGARSLNVGVSIASQSSNATAIAQQYFAANFPPGLLNSTNATAAVTITPPSSSNGEMTFVQVQAAARVNSYFLGLLGHPTSAIQASATTSRREINVVLALDRSGSMSGVCSIMKNDAANFVSMFVDGRDAVGLITFMGNANVDYPWTVDFKSQSPSITDTLAKLNCGGNTGSAAALSLAHQQIQTARVQRPWASNVIVFFTDGVPNGYLAGPPPTPTTHPGFPLKTGSCNGLSTVAGYIADGGGIDDPTPQPIFSTSAPTITTCPHGGFAQLAQSYSYIPQTDYYGNSALDSGYTSPYAGVARDGSNNVVFTQANSDAISQNAADDAARQIRRDGIFVYTIGLDGNGGVDNTLLRRFANDPASPIYSSSEPSGKYYYSPNAGQLGAAFNSIASEILRLAR
jgi:Flp pilus assembly protein TadG